MSIAPDCYVRTSYMSRRIDVPPLVSQAAYDVHAGRSAGDGWAISVSAARLVLRGPVLRPSGAGWRALRSQGGTLNVGRYRWPVELEVLPWSSERTELGLRPCSRTLRAIPPDLVMRAGHELLDGLAASMRAWADQPLRDWAASSAVGERA